MQREPFTEFRSKPGTSKRMGLLFSPRSKLKVKYQVPDELKRLERQIVDAGLIPDGD